MMEVKVSKDKKTPADGLIEKTSLLDKIESKKVYKDEEGDQLRKKK